MKWIDVNERLPEEGQIVLAVIGKGITIDLYENESFNADDWAEHMNIAGGNCGNVTHWMPLPEPPK